jgi:hypothetical protein
MAMALPQEGIITVEITVKTLTKAAGLAGILALTLTGGASLSAAQLAGLPEGQAVVTKLDANASAITYWASGADGWHVVTTVDTVTGQAGSDQHAIVRFTTSLQPGQSQIISVPAPVDQPSPSLRISRIGDEVKVERVDTLSR